MKVMEVPWRSNLIVVVFITAAVFAPAAIGSPASQQLAVLGRGSLGPRFPWVAWVEGPSNATRSTRRTCLTVDVSEEGPEVVSESESRECSSVSRHRPLGQSVSIGEGNSERTALAMTFVVSARRLHIDFGPRGDKWINLRTLSKVRARKAGVRPLAYWTHGFKGSFCLHRFTVYNRKGLKLSDSGKIPCKGQ